MTSVPGRPDLPDPGTRVSLRYVRPPGSEPAMGDVIGQLIEVGPRVRVRAGDGAVHEFRLSDVLYVRRLTDRPVKNSQIRAVEHAAALAWPGLEQQWLDGWLLRAGQGSTLRANSAVPLDRFARTSALPAIIDWYAQRALTPWLAVPERLLRLPESLPTRCETRTMVRDISAEEGAGVVLSRQPDSDWLGGYARDVPVEVLTAVVDGQVIFASIPGVAVGRAALTPGPDGQRWVGLSEVRVAADQRRHGHGRTLCEALLGWGRRHGATQAYAQVRSDTDGTAAFDFFASVGFIGQHRSRYLDARTLHP